MTLSVPIDQFADAVRRVLRHDEAYVTACGDGSVATAYSMDKGIRVLARAPGEPAALCERLKAAGLKVQMGQWLSPEEAEEEVEAGTPYVAAVAYATGEAQPGIWVDAFEHLPTASQALRSLYDEFRDTGELGDIAFEEFVRLANPNVVVVSPTELRSYAEGKES